MPDYGDNVIDLQAYRDQKNSHIPKSEQNQEKTPYAPPEIQEDEQGKASTNMASERARERKTGMSENVLNAAKNMGRRLPNPVRNIRNAVRRRKLEAEIKKIDKELKPINKDVSKLERKIGLIKKGAASIDGAKACGVYIGVMSGFWWWTIIGALIDILIVVPTIFIIYLSGIIKGAFAKKAAQILKKDEKNLEEKKDIQNKKNREKQIISRQKAEQEQMEKAA